MKIKNIHLLILLLLISTTTKSQLENDRTIYANSITINGEGNEKIGKIIKVEGLRSYMFLKTCSQTKDSAGNYITEFKFCNPNRLAPLNVTIVLQFDNIIDTVISTTDSLAQNVRTTFADNNLGASYHASKIQANGILTMVVRSKRKIFSSITGIEGQLK